MCNWEEYRYKYGVERGDGFCKEGHYFFEQLKSGGADSCDTICIPDQVISEIPVMHKAIKDDFAIGIVMRVCGETDHSKLFDEMLNLYNIPKTQCN